MSELFHPTNDHLEAFVEGTLPASDRVIVESHLLGCSRCQTSVEEWRNLFSALSGLPQFEPTPDFTDRVMAHVRMPVPSLWRQYAGREVWARYTDRVGAALSRLTPQTTLGLSLAAACMGLPIVLLAGIGAWLLQQAALTPREALTHVSTWMVEGLQGVGATAVSTVVQTDVAVWLMGRFAEIIETGGLTGIGTALGVAGVSAVLSAWVLYRNLFRSPTRGSNHVLYSF